MANYKDILSRYKDKLATEDRALTQSELYNKASSQFTPASSLEDLAKAKQYDALSAFQDLSPEDLRRQDIIDTFKSAMSDEAIPQGQPYGGVDNRLVGRSYGEINPTSPMAEISEKRLAKSFEQALPDYKSPIQKFPSQADEIGSLFSKYATGKEQLPTTSIFDLPTERNLVPISDFKGQMEKFPTQIDDLKSMAAKGIYPESSLVSQNSPYLSQYKGQIEKFPSDEFVPEVVKNKFSKEAAPYYNQFKKSDINLGRVVDNQAQSSIVPESLVGTESIDLPSNTPKGLAKIKDFVTNPKTLAGLATIPIEMAVNIAGAPSGNVGPFEPNTAGAAENTVYGDLERGKRRSVNNSDFSSMPDPKILDLFSRYDKNAFNGIIGDKSNLGPLNKDQAVENQSLEKKISPEIKKEISSNPSKAKENAVAKIDEANKVLSSKDSSDKEYDDAIKQRNMNQFIATLAQAAERIGYSLAGANAQVLKPDLTFTNRMLEQANQPVVDLKEKRKVAEEKAESDRKKALRDPNSPESKQIRDMMSQVSPGLAKSFEGMSGQDLIERSGIAQGYENRLQREQAARQHAEVMKLQREHASNKVLNSQDVKFATDKLGKLRVGLQEESKNLDSAMSAALNATDNPQALAALAPMLVKVYEGKGARVTDEDRKAAIGASGLVDKFKQWIEKGSKGTLPGVTQGQVINFLQQMSDVHKKAIQRTIDQEIESYAKATKRPLSEIADQFGHSGTQPQQTVKQDPQIKKYADEHNLTYDQAKEWLSE